jgi:putative GTP pyrophosphokinase
VTYSKSRVDRAGRFLAETLRAAGEAERSVGHRRAELEDAIRVVEWWRREHAKPLSRVAANLRYYAAEEGEPVVAQRLKKFPTIADKLLREPSMKLSRMADIGGVRAVLTDQGAVDRVTSRLRKNWTIVRVRDYVDSPKADGYRAVHLINRNHGRLIEVQLRTPNQDAWANTVESFSRTIAPGLKFGVGPPVLRDYFIAVGEFFAATDHELPVDVSLAARVRELQRQADTLIERFFDEP